MILSIEQILRYLHHFGIYIMQDSMTLYEQSMLFGLGNLVWLVLLFFLFYVIYKIGVRVISKLF